MKEREGKESGEGRGRKVRGGEKRKEGGEGRRGKEGRGDREGGREVRERVGGR